MRASTLIFGKQTTIFPGLWQAAGLTVCCWTPGVSREPCLCAGQQPYRHHLQALPGGCGEASVWLVLGVPKWGQGLQVPPRPAARLRAQVPNEGVSVGVGSWSHVAGITCRPLHRVQQLPQPASGETDTVVRVQSKVRHGVGRLVADLLPWTSVVMTVKNYACCREGI